MSSAPCQMSRRDHSSEPGCAQARASGTTTSEPDASARNQLRQKVGTSELPMTPPARSETIATVAVIAAPAAIATSMPPTRSSRSRAPAAAEQPAQEQGDDEDVRHVAQREPERAAQRLGGVGQRQVPDQDARPEAQAAQVERRHADADRQPDRRHGAGVLQGEAGLARAVVAGREQEHPQRVAERREQAVDRQPCGRVGHDGSAGGDRGMWCGAHLSSSPARYSRTSRFGARASHASVTTSSSRSSSISGSRTSTAG